MRPSARCLAPGNPSIQPQYPRLSRPVLSSLKVECRNARCGSDWESGCQVGRVPALWSACGEQRVPVKVFARDPVVPPWGGGWRQYKGWVSCFQPLGLENRGS